MSTDSASDGPQDAPEDWTESAGPRSLAGYFPGYELGSETAPSASPASAQQGFSYPAPGGPLTDPPSWANQDLPPWAPPMPYWQARRLYASWGRRFLARLIDYLPLMGAWSLIVILEAIGARPMRDATGQVVTSAGTVRTELGTGAVIMIIVVGIAFVAYFVWNSMIRQGLHGKTIGKTVMKITTMSFDSGGSPGIGTAAARTLLDFLNVALWGLGFWWAAGDRRAQTFSDKIVGTVVIDDSVMAAGIVAGNPPVQAGVGEGGRGIEGEELTAD